MRREGKIPVILYGPTTDNVSLIVKKTDIFRILKSETGENTIFKVSIDSEKQDAMIKEIQTDPVSDEILHTDLIQIAMDKAVQVSIPIVFEGEAIGVKAEGGFIDVITREVEVECLPKDIPEKVTLDISDLHLNQSMKVEDIRVQENVEILSDPNTIVVHIAAPVAEEVVVEEGEEEEIIGEEEEPEVIKKEKAEEEEQKEKEDKKEGEAEEKKE